MPAPFPENRLRRAGISAARIAQLRADYETAPPARQDTLRGVFAGATDETLRAVYDPDGASDPGVTAEQLAALLPVRLSDTELRNLAAAVVAAARDTDPERESFVPERLGNAALRAAYRSLIAEEIDDPQTLIGAAAGKTSARVALDMAGDRFYSPASQLAFTPVGTVAYVPTSIGTDGLAYGVQSEGSTRLIRSGDGFDTVSLGADLATAGAVDPVLWAGRVAEGYIAVTSNGSTRGAMWFSTTWTTGWTKTRDLTTGRGTALIAVGRPEWDETTRATIMGVGEYTQQAGALHRLWITRDGGQTWTDSFSRAAVDAANNNHIHAWTFDPLTRRMWVSQGDGRNAWFGYSDDLGANWTPLPAFGMPVGTFTPPTQFHQPPVLVAAEKYLITCPDAGNAGTNQSAVWIVDKGNGGAVAEALRIANVDGHRQYASGPVAMSTDRRRVYMLFPQSPTVGATNELYVAATADGGRSWSKVYTGPSALGDEHLTGIVGPDAGGRLFLSPKTNGATARTLLRATEPTWTSVPVGARATGASDIRAVLALAGLLSSTGAAGLDLLGGRARAGNVSVNAQNGQLTFGAGNGDVGVIDTVAGTGQLRVRINGTEICRFDTNTIYAPAGKRIQFGVSGTVPSISSGTGSPEGVVTANPGSLYLRADGGATTSVYIKESSPGLTTGWVAK